jgi:hypothetical protein
MKNLIFAIVVCSVLSGCADNVTFLQATTHEQVGFLHGLWHGIILPFSWIIALFDNDATIYAIYNNGGWYNFGFVIGAGSFFSWKK